MMEWLIDAVATARLTRLIVEDDIATDLRIAVFDRPFLGPLTRCRWCTGIWVGFAVMVLRLVYPRQWRWIARALACAYVAGFAQYVEPS